MHHQPYCRSHQPALRRFFHWSLALVSAFLATSLPAQVSNRGTVSGIVSNQAT
ncbi:MAG: hypothetical protein HY736_09615, partial [Verrucomicrobia bacterium]|nr:hypothetical protein [Verrucomicrobiota bacterium]